MRGPPSRRSPARRSGGTPEQIVEKVAHVVDLTGSDYLVFAFSYGGLPYEDAEASLRLFTAEALPRLRSLGPGA